MHPRDPQSDYLTRNEAIFTILAFVIFLATLAVTAYQCAWGEAERAAAARPDAGETEGGRGLPGGAGSFAPVEQPQRRH